MAAGFLVGGGGQITAAIVEAMQTPEVGYAFNPKTEFNDEFGPAAVLRLARERADSRLKTKAKRRARYQRMHDRFRTYPSRYTLVREDITDDLYAMDLAGVIIMDDQHAEMPTDQARASMLAWYEKSFAKRLT